MRRISYDDLGPAQQALIDEAGGGNQTVVSARMVEALNGNGNAAILLSQLMFWSRTKATEEGWFFRTREQMRERCGLAKSAQKSAESALQELGLVEKELRGMPAKNHYRLNFREIISALSGDEQDRGLVRDQDRGLTLEQDRGHGCDQDRGLTLEHRQEDNRQETRQDTETNKGSDSSDPSLAHIDLDGWRWDDWEFQIALYFLTGLKNHDPKDTGFGLLSGHYRKELKSGTPPEEIAAGWADTFRLLNEQDGYEPEQIGITVQWLFQVNNFWTEKRAIQSAKSLRSSIDDGDGHTTKFDSMLQSALSDYEQHDDNQTDPDEIRQGWDDAIEEYEQNHASDTSGDSIPSEPEVGGAAV
jgi:hypothetical protein